ncbi:fasciclin domain-containing protein [Pricia sp.]|uniref:fasciclin domain-containing protein n=1 Tax=Pricia sp. TaxID=2268138 RepID=UPI003593F518
MKMRITQFFTLAAALIFFNFSASAQSSNDAILSKVESPKKYTTFQLISMDKELSTFANLVILSGLAQSMQMTDGHTLFVPTNDAFNDMTIERFTELTDPKNSTELVAFVKHHVMPTKQMMVAFDDGQVITTPDENEIAVDQDSYDNVFISGSKIIKSDIAASNGVIHIVNGVIDPSSDIL